MQTKSGTIKIFALVLVLSLFAVMTPFLSLSVTAQENTHAAVISIMVNEVDADNLSTDTEEFVELFDGGTGNTLLDGLVLVFYNGNGDASYEAFDLDGYSTGADGYFVLCGDAAKVSNCDLDVSPDSNLIQNGADAVALYTGNAADFPSGTAVTTVNLIDAIVYDTDDADDTGLLPLLNPSQPQVNENAKGNGTIQSNQRCPNGSGGLRDTDTYDQFAPTPGSENTCVEDVIVIGACGDPGTFIHTIQGTGGSSPEIGNQHVIEGVVVGDFQDTSTELRGFFLQEEDSDADADPLTSEGIFVFDNGFGTDVLAGDVVRVLGTVSEYSGLTQISSITDLAMCASSVTITAANVTLPVVSISDWERYEGMAVDIAGRLYAADTYNLGRYGEVGLSSEPRLFIPTNVVEPGSDAIDLQAENDLTRILLDDGSTQSNPEALPYLIDGTSLRAGDSIPSLIGVLSYGFGSYRVHPTTVVNFTAQNLRPEPQGERIGSIKIASFNVLNYFTTIDTGAYICGPSGGMECRGADSAEEFTRQRDKIISAIQAMDADIMGLIEIENNASAAIQDLIDGINTAMGAGTYAFIDTGVIGTDAIKIALIYKPASVSPVGDYAILDSTVDPNFIDTLNRPVLVQTFEYGFGEKVTVAVNHLKSKGSPCLGDPDTGDGQGNCNQTRKKAAQALMGWLATDPTGSGDSDFLIIGDLNSYAMEDPIDVIKGTGYTDLIAAFSNGDAYSYVFDGQFGYLDHALASASLTPQVKDTVVWYINADEPRALDYNDYNQDALYQPDPYRSSDHDPVLVYIQYADLLYLPLILR